MAGPSGRGRDWRHRRSRRRTPPGRRRRPCRGSARAPGERAGARGALAPLDQRRIQAPAPPPAARTRGWLFPTPVAWTGSRRSARASGGRPRAEDLHVDDLGPLPGPRDGRSAAQVGHVRHRGFPQHPLARCQLPQLEQTQPEPHLGAVALRGPHRPGRGPCDGRSTWAGRCGEPARRRQGRRSCGRNAESTPRAAQVCCFRAALLHCRRYVASCGTGDCPVPRRVDDG